MQKFNLISINKKVCGGKPVVKGTRITVEQVYSILHSGGIKELIEDYNLSLEEIEEAQLYCLNKK